MRTYYCSKIYLNASHFITIGGKQGQVHPHTWEFTFTYTVPEGDFVAFNDYEQHIRQVIEPYNGKVLNEVAPFDLTVPTLESLTLHIAKSSRTVLDEQADALIRVEGRETPTRAYIVDFQDEIDASASPVPDAVTRALSQLGSHATE
jgi:6-pyruvoyltetrahydropterin/6-carboxytetrahydropterin synthase